MTASSERERSRVALIEAGSPGLNIYSHVAMGRGAALLATVVRDAGYDVRAFIEDISGKDTIDWRFVSSADVIGFSSITCTLPRTRRLVERARRENPRAVVVFGGPEPTCEPSRSLDAGADIVLRGEAELSFPMLLETVSTGGGIDRVPGAVWREDGTIRQGPEPRQLASSELEELPLVDWSLVDGSEEMPVVPVWRTRGCPHRCDFCQVREIWPKPAARGVDRTLGEMMRAQEAGCRSVFLIDDNAAVDKNAFKDLLRRASERGFFRPLLVQLRADAVVDAHGRVDRELLRLLRRAASFTVACIGLESADDEDLARVGKRMDVKRTEQALRSLRRYGVLVHGMFIALKEDGRQAIRRNGRFARRYITSLQYLFETPLPGTERTRKHQREDALLFESPEDLSLYDGMHLVLKPDRLSPSEMHDLVLREYKRFYSRWQIGKAAIRGVFVRHRLLTGAQRRYLRELPLLGRIRSWAWFHVEYRFAPVSFLAVGRKRVAKMLRDPAEARHAARLRSIGVASVAQEADVLQRPRGRARQGA